MSVKLAKRLVEPDFWTCPHGVKQRPASFLTYGPEVADLNAKANFEPDPQQELGLDLIFAIKPDGSPASFEVCVICCRQNLKTGLFKQAAIGWLFVTEQPLVVWSAHEMSTTSEAQRDLANTMLDAPMLRKRMMPNENNGVYHANGEERIELATGQRVMFKARTKDGGRGLTAPKLILDEAFALKPSMMGSLLPLMMAQKDPQVLYGSSAGKADSEVLFDIRERGRTGISPAMTYLEWLSPRERCAEEDCKHPKDAAARGVDCALDREHLIRKANPTITTGRIQIETVRNLRQALPPAEFARECLGWWDEPTKQGEVIPSDAWGARQVEPGDAPAASVAPNALGLDRWYDGATAVAGAWRDLDTYHVELVAVDVSPDTTSVVRWVAERAGKRIPVVVAGDSPAAALVPELRALKVAVIVTSVADLGKACVGFRDDVLQERLSHANQDHLNAALAGAKKRRIGDAGMWGWDRKAPDLDISPLMAATLARFGAAVSKGKRQRTGQTFGR